MKHNLLLLMLLIVIAAPVFAAQNGEAHHARAVLSYHAQDYDGALKELKQALKESPDDKESLALKALVLRKQDRLIESIQTYSRLVRPPVTQNKEVASYQFELGTIYFNQKNYHRAVPCFRYAIRSDFNTSAAHFYLGQIAFQRKQWSRAQLHLDQVLKLNTSDLKPGAHIYLAQIAAQNKNSLGVVKNLVAARDLASVRASNEKLPPSVQQVNATTLESVEKWLAPFDQDARAASVGLETGYDSNVFLSPPGVSSAIAGSSGKQSAKTTLKLGLTLGNSPLKSWQWIASYSGSANYNFNNDTRNGQFINNSISLYLIRGNFKDIRYGWKLGGDYVFRYDLSPSIGSARYRTFRLLGSTGPFASFNLGGDWQLGAELFFQPQKFYLDGEGAATSARSGWEQMGRVFLRSDARTKYFNPTASFTFTHKFTTGVDYRAQESSLSLSNVFYPWPKVISTFGVGAIYTGFGERSGGLRADTTLSYSSTTQYYWDEALSFNLTLSYLNNFSNLTGAYSFDRYYISTGANYMF